jgi:autotransporter-associated beta strand protein
VAVFKTNSTLRANQIRMRGNANGNFMLFEGGDHAIYGGLQLGEGATNARWTNTVEVLGGTLAFPGSALYISHGKTNSYGVFSVSGSGVVTLANNIVMSSNQGRTLSALRLSDSAVLRSGGYLDVAYTLASTATVSLAGSALLSLGGNLAVARGNESFATLDLRDQSACTAGGYLLVGGYSGSDGTVTVQDGATLHVVNYAEAGTGGGTGRLRLTGGRLIAKNVRGGAGGSSEFYADGGTLCASNTSDAVSLLVKFGLAELGATGLTLDSAGYDAAIAQAFADASGVDGRFLKTGAGTLSVSNSTHALTVVAQGGLRVLETAAVFGRSLVVTNQAALSLSGAAAELTVGNLTLGEPGAPASLHMDAGDRITVTNSGGLTLASCGLFFGSPSTDGTYDLFHCAGSVDGSVLNNLAVFNPAPGKDYTFTIVPDDTDSIIRLTVADFAITEAVWNGSQGSDWNTAANWTPAELPTNGTRTFFNADGEQKTVNLSAPAVCTHLNFNSAEPYLLQGAQLSVAVGGVSNTLGTHTLAMPLALAGGITVGTASAATTTVSGAVSGNLATTVTKTGSGTLTLSGDNAAFAGTWQTSGGRLEAASPTALGGANTATDAVRLGAGTLTYSGTPTTLNKGITLNSGNISNAVIIDARRPRPDRAVHDAAQPAVQAWSGRAHPDRRQRDDPALRRQRQRQRQHHPDGRHQPARERRRARVADRAGRVQYPRRHLPRQRQRLGRLDRRPAALRHHRRAVRRSPCRPRARTRRGPHESGRQRHASSARQPDERLQPGAHADAAAPQRGDPLVGSPAHGRHARHHLRAHAGDEQRDPLRRLADQHRRGQQHRAGRPADAGQQRQRLRRQPVRRRRLRRAQRRCAGGGGKRPRPERHRGQFPLQRRLLQRHHALRERRHHAVHAVPGA